MGMRGPANRLVNTTSESQAGDEEGYEDDYSGEFSESPSRGRSFGSDVSPRDNRDRIERRPKKLHEQREVPVERSSSSIYSSSPNVGTYDEGSFISGEEDLSGSRSETKFSMEEYSDYTPSSTPLSGSYLSSSMSHALFESPMAQTVKRFVRAVERPLLFGATAVAGSRVLRLLVALSNTVFLTHPSGIGGSSAVDGMLMEVGGERGLPEGYPVVPQWMQEMRASLPVQLVEKPVMRWLRWSGIPVLSEGLQNEAGQRWSSTTAAVSEGVRALKEMSRGDVEVWVTSRPMIPTIVMLPVLTLVLLRIGRSWNEQRVKEMREAALPNWIDESVSELPSGIAVGSHRELSPPVEAPREEYLEGRWIAQGVQSPVPLPSPSPCASPVRPPDSSEHDTVSAGEEPVSPEMQRILKTPESSAVLRKMAPSASGSAHVTFPPLREPLVERMFSMGTVFAALVGVPTQEEVSQVLMACVEYGCMKVLLPLSAQSMVHTTVPLTTSVEFSADVLKAVENLSGQSQIPIVGVFARAVVPDAVHLSLFKHPPTGIYVFSAGIAASLERLTEVATGVVYTFEHGPLDVIPISECFSQRLRSLQLQGVK